MTDSFDSPVPDPVPAAHGFTAGSPSGVKPTFSVTFWGVRGNVPSPGARTVRYGGNTACVEIQVGNQHLILDGGTGLVGLGKDLMLRGDGVDAKLFFTHTHWDRIQGFPFFLPAFSPSTRLAIYGAAALNGASIKQQLMNQMLRPNFFKPLQTMEAEMVFHNIQAGSTVELEEVRVETISLNPQTRALGFRISWGGHALVYATDTDHTQTMPDANLIFLADGADLLILDGTYADTAYADLEANQAVPYPLAVKVAQTARVANLVLFHHNPCQDDDQLDELEREVRSHFPNTRIAYEGMTITVA